MKNYNFHNTLISKKHLKQILAWSFTKYGSVQASLLADELKYFGFLYSTQAGISISIEDLRIPPIKRSMLKKSNAEILKTENQFLSGNITEVERFQKIIDIWNYTSETLKDELVKYFKNYDPLNSVYIMAFSGARGNLSQVRQLVGMRGLMSDPNGESMDVPIKQNFREGLTVTDYLMSGYGARKGIVDTALKTANSGYLTRRLIDVAQDVIIREKNCLTKQSLLIVNFQKDTILKNSLYDRILGRLINKNIYNPLTKKLLVEKNTQITLSLIKILEQKNIQNVFIRSPLICKLNRSVCQKCYGWNLAYENLVDLGEAVGIIAGQSIGEPGTQLTMRTFHTGGIFTAGAYQQIISPSDGIITFSDFLKTISYRTNGGENVLISKNSGILTLSSKKSHNIFKIEIPNQTVLFIKNNQQIEKDYIIGHLAKTINQTKRETKYISSKLDGEIIRPNFKEFSDEKNSTNLNSEKLIWVLAGQQFDVPRDSFLNLAEDFKINQDYYIIRTKLITQQSGTLRIANSNKDLEQKALQIISNAISLIPTKIQKFSALFNQKSYFFNIQNLKYTLNLISKNFSQFHLNEKLLKFGLQNQNFANLVSNNYNVLTGGTIYLLDNIFLNRKSIISGGSFLWLAEECHKINQSVENLLVEDSEFIVENYEIIENLFSKLAGMVKIIEKNNIVQEISIKSGLLFKMDKLTKFFKLNNKVFYPGEVLLETIIITNLSLIEIIKTPLNIKILVRPLHIYEVSKPKPIKKIYNHKSLNKNPFLKITNHAKINYFPGEKIKTTQPLNLVTQSLNLKLFQLISSKNKTDLLEVFGTVSKLSGLQLFVSEKFFISHYQPNKLNKPLKLSLIIENNQYVNSYSILGYFEIVSKRPLNLIQIKSQIQKNKKIALIAEEDCLKISKKINTNEIDNRLIKNINNTGVVGRLLNEKHGLLTIQKGYPYFFPSEAEFYCKNNELIFTGQNIGLLNFEKEITGDIVQGLPRVEEILEARKIKKIKTNRLKLQEKQLDKEFQKKIDDESFLKILDRVKNKIFFKPEISLKTFKFFSLETSTHNSLLNNKRIKLHKELLLYFFYYLTKTLDSRYPLANLNEAAYRSFKKIQGLILVLIQSVYSSQGVAISDKHLEVIIRQMTSNVLIVSENDTPLLSNELITLQQVKYINEAILKDKKKSSFYLPVLLGITKASLNAESFISAASFQETTRVLTKAAIEGEVDWLRGLKENVIIGQLIPAGTGFNTYISKRKLKVSSYKNAYLMSKINNLKQFFK